MVRRAQWEMFWRELRVGMPKTGGLVEGWGKRDERDWEYARVSGGSEFGY